MSSNYYIMIYGYILTFLVSGLLIKYVCNFILLYLFDRKILKQEKSKSYIKLSLKSWIYGILADFIAIVLNIIIGKTFFCNYDIVFIVSGLLNAFVILFIFEYNFVLKNINTSKLIKVAFSIILALFTTAFYWHIPLLYTYV